MPSGEFMIFLKFIQQPSNCTEHNPSEASSHYIKQFPAFCGILITVFTGLMFVTALSMMSHLLALAPCFFMIQFKLSLLFTPMSAEWCHLLKFTKQICMHLSLHT
jgi:hypothetical protein